MTLFYFILVSGECSHCPSEIIHGMIDLKACVSVQQTKKMLEQNAFGAREPRSVNCGNSESKLCFTSLI